MANEIQMLSKDQTDLDRESPMDHLCHSPPPIVPVVFNKKMFYVLPIYKGKKAYIQRKNGPQPGSYVVQCNKFIINHPRTICAIMF